MPAKTDFLIGADPELALLRRGQFVDACGIIGDNDHSKRFGVDGGGAVAELRPPPAFSPRKVVANIQRAMASTPESVRRLDWRAGSATLNRPTGGHIHFGIRDLVPNG